MIFWGVIIPIIVGLWILSVIRDHVAKMEVCVNNMAACLDRMETMQRTQPLTPLVDALDRVENQLDSIRVELYQEVP